MKRKGWPIWLLRDLPALLGVMLSFWPLVILLISSECRVMRGKAIRRSVFETIALLLAHAEARLTFALTRQAYRRLGWNPRLVRFNLIPATYNLRDVQERYANYVNAFGDMNSVVEAYIEDIRAALSHQRTRSCVRFHARACSRSPCHALEVLPRRQAGEVDRRAFAARRRGLRALVRTRTAASVCSNSKSPPTHLARPAREAAPACANEKAALADGLSFKSGSVKSRNCRSAAAPRAGQPSGPARV